MDIETSEKQPSLIKAKRKTLAPVDVATENLIQRLSGYKPGLELPPSPFIGEVGSIKRNMPRVSSAETNLAEPRFNTFY